MTDNHTQAPFTKRFHDGAYYYVYDVNTNRIIEVDKPVYEVIGEYKEDDNQMLESNFKGTYTAAQLQESIQKIKAASEKHGLFSHFRPESITMGIKTAEGVKKLHQSGLQQLILEITRQCNLNCRYCAASGKYADHETFPVQMDTETCKKAVDFFCDRNADYEKPIITFYGGEPLLKFGLIERIVEYVKTKYIGKDYKFNLTINGTLLTKDIIDFFIKHDFSVTISIDGPQQINDRYRRFKNNKGTFNRIMKNLEFLKNYNPEFFAKNVSISSVLSPPFNHINEIFDFFSTHKAVSEIKSRIRSSLVDTRETSFIEDFGLEESMRELPAFNKKKIARLKEAVLKASINDLTIEKQRIFSILYNIIRRPIKKLHKHAHPFGACHIGLRRVFVRANGDFFVCERSGKDYKIGSLKNGFDYEQIAHYYKTLGKALDDCRNCWAQLHCERCWAALGNLDRFSGEKKERFCTASKNTIETAFKLYTQLLRENPDSLKVFRDVLIA